jgi:hypothetical protein
VHSQLTDKFKVTSNGPRRTWTMDVTGDFALRTSIPRWAFGLSIGAMPWDATRRADRFHTGH